MDPKQHTTQTTTGSGAGKLLTFHPAELDFGEVQPQRTYTTKITITNPLGVDVKFSVKPGSPARYEVEPSGEIILKNAQSITLEIKLRTPAPPARQVARKQHRDVFLIKSEYFHQKFYATYQLGSAAKSTTANTTESQYASGPAHASQITELRRVNEDLQTRLREWERRFADAEALRQAQVADRDARILSLEHQLASKVTAHTVSTTQFDPNTELQQAQRTIAALEREKQAVEQNYNRLLREMQSRPNHNQRPSEGTTDATQLLRDEVERYKQRLREVEEEFAAFREKITLNRLDEVRTRRSAHTGNDGPSTAWRDLHTENELLRQQHREFVRVLDEIRESYRKKVSELAKQKRLVDARVRQLELEQNASAKALADAHAEIDQWRASVGDAQRRIEALEAALASVNSADASKWPAQGASKDRQLIAALSVQCAAALAAEAAAEHRVDTAKRQASIALSEALQYRTTAERLAAALREQDTTVIELSDTKDMLEQEMDAMAGELERRNRQITRLRGVVEKYHRQMEQIQRMLEDVQKHAREERAQHQEEIRRVVESFGATTRGFQQAEQLELHKQLVFAQWQVDHLTHRASAADALVERVIATIATHTAPSLEDNTKAERYEEGEDEEDGGLVAMETKVKLLMTQLQEAGQAAIEAAAQRHSLEVELDQAKRTISEYEMRLANQLASHRDELGSLARKVEAEVNQQWLAREGTVKQYIEGRLRELVAMATRDSDKIAAIANEAAAWRAAESDIRIRLAQALKRNDSLDLEIQRLRSELERLTPPNPSKEADRTTDTELSEEISGKKLEHARIQSQIELLEAKCSELVKKLSEQHEQFTQQIAALTADRKQLESTLHEQEQFFNEQRQQWIGLVQRQGEELARSHGNHQSRDTQLKEAYQRLANENVKLVVKVTKPEHTNATLRDELEKYKQVVEQELESPSVAGQPHSAGRHDNQQQFYYKKFLRTKLAEVDAQRKLRVCARVERELRQLLKDRDDRIHELKGELASKQRMHFIKAQLSGAAIGEDGSGFEVGDNSGEKSDVYTLHKQLAIKDEEVRQLQEKLAEATAQCGREDVDLVDIMSKLETANERERDLQRQIQQAKEQAALEKDKIAQKVKTLQRELKSHRKRAESEIKALRKQLEEALSAATPTPSSAELREHQKDLELLRVSEERDQLQREVENLKQQLSTAATTKPSPSPMKATTDTMYIIESLRSQLDEFQSLATRLQLEKDEKERELRAQLVAAQELQRTCESEYSARLSRERAQWDEYMQRLVADEKRTLQESFDARERLLREAISRLEHENSELLRKLIDKEQQLRQPEPPRVDIEEVQRMREALVQAAAKLADAEQQSERLRVDVDNERKQRELAQQQLKDMRSDLARVLDELKALEHRRKEEMRRWMKERRDWLKQAKTNEDALAERQKRERELLEAERKDREREMREWATKLRELDAKMAELRTENGTLKAKEHERHALEEKVKRLTKDLKRKDILLNELRGKLKEAKTQEKSEHSREKQQSERLRALLEDDKRKEVTIKEQRVRIEELRSKVEERDKKLTELKEKARQRLEKSDQQLRSYRQRIDQLAIELEDERAMRIAAQAASQRKAEAETKKVLIPFAEMERLQFAVSLVEEFKQAVRHIAQATLTRIEHAKPIDVAGEQAEPQQNKRQATPTNAAPPWLTKAKTLGKAILNISASDLDDIMNTSTASAVAANDVRQRIAGADPEEAQRKADQLWRELRKETPSAEDIVRLLIELVVLEAQCNVR